MKRLKALRARKTELVAKYSAIVNAPAGKTEAGEPTDTLTAEQRGEADKIKAQLDEVKADLAHAEALEAEERDAPAIPDANEDAEEAATSASRKGPLFESLGHQMQAVIRAGHRDRIFPVDPRLVLTDANGTPLPKAAATGMNEKIGSEGGFLVEKARSSTLLKRAHDVGKIWSRVTQMPVPAGANGWKGFMVDETSRANGSRWGGIRVYWTPEAGLKVASMPALTTWEIPLTKVTGLLYVTDELKEDAAALDVFVEEAFPEELKVAVEEAILFGTGVGMPLGFFNSGSVISVGAEGGQAADTFVYLNAVNMLARLDPASLDNAVWLYNPALIVQFAQMQFTPSGGSSIPVFLPAGGASGKPFNTLFGLPMIPSEQMAAIGDVGDIALVDFSQYLLATKGGIKTDMSIHVRFIYDESVFRFVLRVGGAPKWAAPLTPKNGSVTVAPAVVLAAR